MPGILNMKVQLPACKPGIHEGLAPPGSSKTRLEIDSYSSSMFLSVEISSTKCPANYSQGRISGHYTASHRWMSQQVICGVIWHGWWIEGSFDSLSEPSEVPILDCEHIEPSKQKDAHIIEYPWRVSSVASCRD